MFTVLPIKNEDAAIYFTNKGSMTFYIINKENLLAYFKDDKELLELLDKKKYAKAINAFNEKHSH
jgi:hypothetical protein